MKGRRFGCIVAVAIWWLITASNLLLSISQTDTNTATVPARWNIPVQDPDWQPDILLTETNGCGFYQLQDGSLDDYYYYFAVFTIDRYYRRQVVWSANRNSPVKMNSTLELKSDGDLVLKGADGRVVWSTETSGKSVVGINLTEVGNLVLFDHKKRIVWQSFDHPTDTLVLGQTLKVGQKLTSSVSSTNLSESGLFSLTLGRHGLSARLETDPPQLYYHTGHYTPPDGYVQFLDGSLGFYTSDGIPIFHISIRKTANAQYMKFSSDGHLIVYAFHEMYGWEKMEDVLTNIVGACGYPTICGEYGICVSKGLCRCPDSGNEKLIYFNKTNLKQPEQGCYAITPLTCEAHQYQSFLMLDGVTSTGQFDHYHSNYVTVDACKEACANNCSCKAALFNYSGGQCSLLNPVSSLKYSSTTEDVDSVIYIKVQNVPVEVPYHPIAVTRSSKSKVPIILGSIGAALPLLSGVLVFFIMKKIHSSNEVDEEEEEEYYLDQVLGMPNRFSYKELKSFTGDFSKKLGEGGFGSVFEGSLVDNTKIAVKWLRDIGQTSFLTEVQTIGNIHHVNLVKLVGFCAQKSHMLLVYEYMANGSLDRWIFQKKKELMLTWEQRKMVIIDIAKGLHYLHEDCRHKILHLDIKPQNILLDENFNAKVADFGLAKLIERDQSQVMTMMRGTPGYLAPEWLSSTITEKVDVYSFGVVVLEIVCARKVFDTSVEEEDDRYLLSLLKRKAEQGRLIDMVGTNMYPGHKLDAVNMMKLAAWCLQHNYTKRPSMSVVVKVLEGVMNVQEKELDYNFCITPTQSNRGSDSTVIHASPPPLPSVISAPR